MRLLLILQVLDGKKILSYKQGPSKCAVSRKWQRQEKNKSGEGGDRPVCISASKGAGVSL